jgi:hypothetical protein
MKKTIILSLVLTACQAFVVNASTGSSGVTALMLDSYGARPIGLADAFTGVADDVNAISVNPAGLATLPSIQVQAMHMNDFTGQAETFWYGAAAVPFLKAFCAGVSVYSFGLAAFDGLGNTGLPTGRSLSAGDLVLSLAFAADPMRLRAGSRFGLSLGFAGRFVQTELAGVARSAFSADAGILFRTGLPELGGMKKKDNFGFGFAVQNMGAGVEYVSERTGLPMNVRAGFGYEVFRDRRQGVLVSADANFPNDSGPIIAAGAEYSLLGMFAVRLGYRFTGPEAAGLTAGAGFAVLLGGKRFSADYAIVPMGDLGILHAFGLGVKF